MRKVDLNQRKWLITELAEVVTSYAEETDREPSSVALNLTDLIPEIIGFNQDVKDIYNELVIHELLNNVERALETSVDNIKANEVYIVGDESEIDSKIRDDVYDAVKNLEDGGGD